MENYPVSERKPIGKILGEINSRKKVNIANSLSDEFDMYRTVNTDSITKAASYAYMEHLLRVTTYPEDFSEIQTFFKKKLRTKMLSLLELMEKSNTIAMQTLQDQITDDDLSLLVKNPCKLKIYQIKNSKLTFEEALPIYEITHMPIIYLIAIDKVHILYTPTMSFVDGYDPYLGIQKEPLIPTSFITKARENLYISVKGADFDELAYQDFREISPSPIIKERDYQNGRDVFSSYESDFKSGLKLGKPPKDLEEIQHPLNASQDKKDPANTNSNNMFSYTLNRYEEETDVQEQADELDIDERGYESSVEMMSDEENESQNEQEETKDTQFEWIKKSNFKNIPESDWRKTEKEIKKNRDLCTLDACLIF